MSVDLVLKRSCDSCGSAAGLYGSACKHLTLCVSCGKKMAEGRVKCYECGTPITRLIREYNVRASSGAGKNYFVGTFPTGLPNIKKMNKNRWLLQKEGPQGRQVTGTLREKYKTKPWVLEDETGQFQYHGLPEGSQSATYYHLTVQGKEFVATPVGQGSWYKFNKVAQYKQLTLEEAEEKMENRRRNAEGYQRWMMKTASNGATAFGLDAKFDDKESASFGGKGSKKTAWDHDEEVDASKRGDQDEKEQESARNSTLGLIKKGGDDDDYGLSDCDLDDSDIDKGDDWEHDETFTDDDEAVGNDPEGRWEDLAPGIPVPPEIQDRMNEDEAGEEEGGLSKSGKELKKLLARANGQDETDTADDFDSDSDDMEDDVFPVYVPKKEVPKEEPVGNTKPTKSTTSGASRGTLSTSKTSDGKRKVNGEEPNTSNSAPAKKAKTANEVKLVKKETGTRTSPPTKGPSPASWSKNGSAPAPAPAPPTGPVSEDEIRALLLQKKPVTTHDLLAKFGSRLKNRDDKHAFAETLKKLSKIQKRNGQAYIVLINK